MLYLQINQTNSFYKKLSFILFKCSAIFLVSCVSMEPTVVNL